MPELPEVETVRRMISPHILGRRITCVTVSKPVIANCSPDEFIKKMTGDIFESVSRRGKYLIFSMNGGRTMVLHLRMTGCLIAAPVNHPYEPHTHVIFGMNDGWELRFSDTRRFGRFWLYDKDESIDDCGIGKLGPEPWDPAIDEEYLGMRIGHSSKPIKECLMNQSVIAGIGNIYSDEILYTTGILPMRRADSLNDDELRSLSANIGKCMEFFLIKNEISDEDYINGHGKDYRNTPFLSVYGRSGLPCPRCGDILSRCVINQRSSVFCKHCQN